MFCPNCGSQVGDGVSFCSSCGTRLNTQSVPQYQSNPTYSNQPYDSNSYYPPMGGQTQTAPKKNNMGSLLIGVIAVVAVIILLFTIFGGGGDPEKIVEDFFDAVLSGDVDKARDCVHPDMWDDIGGDFEDVSSSLELFGGSMNVEVKGSTRADDEEYYVESILEDYDISGKIGDIYVVEVEMTVDFMGMKETDTSEALVAEISGTYYIVDVD